MSTHTKVTKRIANWQPIMEMEELLRNLSLNTVCEGAECPNIAECFSKKTATFMILGEVCTRQCAFCSVRKGKAMKIDQEEPLNIAKASRKLGLRHIVVTSVTRDDLEDGGARHFAETINQIKKLNPLATVEVLIPDLQGKWQALEIIVQAKPEIINHNIETVSSLYEKVRPQANYERSLELFRQIKQINQTIYLKSGLMVGLGEKDEEVLKVMDDLLNVNCEILTIGQYLQPSPKHIEVHEYISENKFEELKRKGIQKGFKQVNSGRFVRSSYNAGTSMQYLRQV